MIQWLQIVYNFFLSFFTLLSEIKEDEALIMFRAKINGDMNTLFLYGCKTNFEEAILTAYNKDSKNLDFNKGLLFACTNNNVNSVILILKLIVDSQYINFRKAIESTSNKKIKCLLRKYRRMLIKKEKRELYNISLEMKKKNQIKKKLNQYIIKNFHKLFHYNKDDIMKPIILETFQLCKQSLK